MRFNGYSLKLAVADIIDNSLPVSAKKIGISLFKPCKGIEDITEQDIPLTHCVTPNKTYSF